MSKRVATSLAIAWLFAFGGIVRQPSATAAEPFTTIALRGRVVFMAEALDRWHGVKSLPEAKENSLVLETRDGTLHVLVEDKIGHSFRLDDRLLGKQMELLVRRYQGSPAVQVIRIHMLIGDKKYLTDYWCDICSIPMYELKPCDCCQGEIRLRQREVVASGEVLLEATIEN